MKTFWSKHPAGGLNCQVRNQDTQLAFWMMIQKWLPGGGRLFGCSEVDPQVANLAVKACLEAQRSSIV